ncbi:MAG: HAD family hydrolase [Myxococcota bacterium]
MADLTSSAPTPRVERRRPAAAFYDLEGTLCSTNIVHTYAYFAQRQPTLVRSIVKTVSTVSQIPFFIAADAYSRKVFNEMFYRRYRGESEDRLNLMAEDMFERVVRPEIFEQAYAMIRQSREAGYRQVMITGALDLLAGPVARHLGMDDYVSNALEYSNGYATGRLRSPLIAGASKATYMRRYAKVHKLDLEECLAYTDSMSDYPMLTTVGKPSVINPDFRLKQLARSFDWPILDFH